MTCFELLTCYFFFGLDYKQIIILGRFHAVHQIQDAEEEKKKQICTCKFDPCYSERFYKKESVLLISIIEWKEKDQMS